MNNSYPNAQCGVYDASKTHLVDYSHPQDHHGHPNGSFGDISSQVAALHRCGRPLRTGLQRQDLYSTVEPMMAQNITVNNRPLYSGRMNECHYSFQNQSLGETAVPSLQNRSHSAGWYATWPPLTSQTLPHRSRPIVVHATPVAPDLSSPNLPPHEEPSSPYESEDLGDITTCPQRPVHSIQPNVIIPGLPYPAALGIVLWMRVPPELCGSEQDIMAYVKKFKKQLDWFKKELDAEVTHVVCSLCLREHSCKPSNLARHLRSHLNVKTYACCVCTDRPGFTTKEQAVVHAQYHHGVARGSTQLGSVIKELKQARNV